MRKESLQPGRFTFLCRALFLSPRCKTRVGVNFSRLLTAGARLVLDRQSTAMDRLLQCSGEMLSSDAVDHSGRLVRLSFSVFWDEVNSKFI